MNSSELLSEYNKFLEIKKKEGKKIIAFLAHDNIPEELFDAADIVPLRMIFAGNDDLMNSSHDFLPPSTCSFAQSCLGLYHLIPNMFEFLQNVDYILLSNHCVTDICVSEIISETSKLPRLDFYVAYARNQNSFKYYRIELDNLKKKIESITKAKISDEKLRESILKYNNFKKVLSKIGNLDILGSQKLELIQKSILFGPDIQPELERFIDRYEEKDFTKNNNYKNIILTGCSIFIGDYLIDLIEESGGNIVFFDSWIGYNYYSQIFEKETLRKIENPLNILTKRFENNLYGDHCIPEYLENKLNFLERWVNRFNKDVNKKPAIINHIIKFCDHFSLFQTNLKNQLKDRGINVLNLERDYSRSNRGQLSTRIEAFLEMI
ncbi:MAG: 2-hydroxyacyl-CoA dehydratase [Candidatus Lokiarchaeota archaeon]|nr:2-hydroxyacyl-CoA dehydratase [Candidatus Lokiarchaeota archaeon]